MTRFTYTLISARANSAYDLRNASSAMRSTSTLFIATCTIVEKNFVTKQNLTRRYQNRREILLRDANRTELIPAKLNENSSIVHPEPPMRGARSGGRSGELKLERFPPKWEWSMAERISHERKSGQSLIGLFSDHFDRHQFRSTVDQLGADLSSTTHSRRDTAFAGYSAHWSDSNTCTSAAPSGFFQV